MAIKTYNDQNFVAIANAIRAKNGETTQYKPSEMAPAIMAIESGLELLPQDTVAGAIANFPDGSNNYPVVELIANIEPKQEGSGDPSPSNVRPISGSTECNIVRAGKNFIKVTNTSGTINGVTFTVNSDSSITCNGTATALTVIRVIAQGGKPLNFEIGKVYTLSGCPSGGSEQTFQLDLRLINSTGTFYSKAKDFGNSFTWTDNVGGAAYPIILIRSGYTCNNLTFKPQIEVGSSATAYEPYQAETKTIDLGGTVYGGTLNVTTGVLTVNRISKVLTSNDNISLKGSGASAYFQINYSPASNSNWQDIIASHFTKNNIYAGGTAQGIGIYLGQVYIRYAQFSSIEDFKNFLDTENNADRQVVITYKLAEPQTYQLTPEQVKTLLGVNNIYADTGVVEVTYRADIDLYIAKKIAEGA